MLPFADRLIEQIRSKGNPCIVGLDPRIDEMPRFIVEQARAAYSDVPGIVRQCISEYHRKIISLVAGSVPAVKLQIAFYEQYGIPGMLAFEDTIAEAKRCGLIVIVDAKRNDIGSTAQAYANSLLGVTEILGEMCPVFDADCITVSPYLGIDSLEPFIDTCRAFGKGVFILVKTSNKGSVDLQNLEVRTHDNQHMPLYMETARIVDKFARESIGSSGYSSIGAVVGATFPAEAETLRAAMPHSIFLVPGYGAQGGTADDVVPCFNGDGLGAVVNASRSVTYSFETLDLSESEFDRVICDRTAAMVADISLAIASKTSKRV